MDERNLTNSLYVIQDLVILSSFLSVYEAQENKMGSKQWDNSIFFSVHEKRKAAIC